MKTFDFELGEVLLMDKALGQTSFQLVKQVKRITKAAKIGHAGTLDPLATGLMILCTGKKTKIIDSFQGQEKEYTGTITLGFVTPSFDMETEPEQHQDTAAITQEQVEAAMAQFVGAIMQRPPVYSAIKVDGKRAYASARKGVEVEIKERPIEIFEFELVRWENPEIHFRVRCSKGTYIRTLAHEVGKQLGVGGTLTALRRTAIGDNRIEDALNLAQLAALFQPEHGDLSQS